VTGASWAFQNGHMKLPQAESISNKAESTLAVMKLPLLLLLHVCGVAALNAQQAPPSGASPPVATTLESLALDVSRVESVREIKDLTSAFAQLAQFGRWADMAALFSQNGTLQWDKTISTGPAAIEKWLKADAAGMDGIAPGSLDTLVASNPLVNLATDGRVAKARYNGWRFQGDGKGGTRIQGGIYENEYVLVGDGEGWKIGLLRYHPLYEGDYAKGWRNAGGGELSEVPFHYSTDEGGIPIPPLSVKDREEAMAKVNSTVEELERRISMLNDEDEVRNLQHAYGYYVDQRMWTDVVDLFAKNSTVRIENVGSFTGPGGVLDAMERWMGPEGLSQGVLNEHLIFNTMVEMQSPREALTRGIEIGLIGDAKNSSAEWQFNVFYNRFIKEDGIWKLQEMEISPLVVADYSKGWGRGSTMPTVTVPPEFLKPVPRSTRAFSKSDASSKAATDLADLNRRLARSAAYDGTENVSNAYGFYIDFIDGAGCKNMADVHATKGHKESPFAGFYQTRDRVLKACTQYYGTGKTEKRASLSYHWRPQPVIQVSHDGRSANIRARLLQPTSDKSGAGIIRGGMYQDQTVLENGIWRLWSVTIDEFYWHMADWKTGWAGAKARAKDASNPAPRDLIRQYPPDLTLTEMGDPRETGFQGGSGRFVDWPEIQRMWFAYRNPVSGREPKSYWPGCVPCQDRPAWQLERNGYQEPPTGPASVQSPKQR